MDLKELLGDAYKEDMTLEEIQEALKGMELVDPKKLPKTVRKEQFDMLASELAATKKQLKEIEHQSLSEEEQRIAQMTAQEELIASLRKEIMRSSAKERLAKAGIESKGFVDSMLESFDVTDDEKFGSFIDTLVTTVKNAEIATEKAVTAKLMADMPKPPEGGEPGTLKTLSKMTYSEQMKLKAERPDEYARLATLSAENKE